MSDRLENIVYSEDNWTIGYYREERQCLMWKTDTFDIQSNVTTKSNVKGKSCVPHAKKSIHFIYNA